MADNRDPEIIRREIEQTRRDLSNNVNELGQSVAPGNVVDRQKRALGQKARSVKESIMGSADDAGTAVSGVVGGAKTSVQDASHTVAETAQDMPRQVRRQTRGNPMAAGLIALGAGWLVGSLFPATRQEREAADALKEHAQPLLEDVKEQAKEVGDKLKEPAMNAVDDLKAEAQHSVEKVKQEGQTAAERVKTSAEDSKANIQSDAEQAKNRVQHS